MDNETIIATLSTYEPTQLAETEQSSAVMVLLLSTHNHPFDIVITERSKSLPLYAGDYSFPGGRRDMTDKTFQEAIIREVQEELQLLPHHYQMIGELDDFQDRFGHLVRPFVATMPKEKFLEEAHFSSHEITSLYYFSLTKLSAIHYDPSLQAMTRRRPSYTFKENNVFIWGLTASILVHLDNILSGSNKPLGKIPDINY